MNDMSPTIVPRSDQWNYDDFIAGPITFKITGVKIRPGTEQPIDFSLEGTNKFYRPCKSMARICVFAWGADASKYAGRSITLYGDPSIKWGGLSVGGIRISHMSDIADQLTVALTVTRANKKPFTVKPLKPSSAPPRTTQAAAPVAPPAAAQNGAAADPTDESLILDITARCKARSYDIAYDLCRAITSEQARADTKARIDAHKTRTTNQQEQP